jgi:8-oxo-dGTP pyrophosphatase MutT (NUDIX family)
VVAGFYDPSPKNWFEDTLAEFTCIRDWNFDHNTFLPSSRSLALKKEIWEEVGKYPEELDTCEDLVFADRLKKHAQHWKVVKDAQVVWDQPKNLQQLADKIFSYASGDLDAKYERHVAKIHKAKWRIIVLLGFAFPILYSSFWPLRVIGIAFFLLYMMGTITKHLRMLKYPQNVVILPLIQLVVDAALVQALVFHTIGARYKK